MSSDVEIKDEDLVGFYTKAFERRHDDSRLLLFTTDRVLVLKHTLKMETFFLVFQGGGTVNVDIAIDREKENFAVPYSILTELEIQLPSAQTQGKVTMRAPKGLCDFLGVPTQERIIELEQKDPEHPPSEKWDFLASPPPKLADKLKVVN